MDEYVLEINDLRRRIAKLKSERASLTIIEELEAQLRILKAIYDSAGGRIRRVAVRLGRVRLGRVGGLRLGAVRLRRGHRLGLAPGVRATQKLAVVVLRKLQRATQRTLRRQRVIAILREPRDALARVLEAVLGERQRRRPVERDQRQRVVAGA